MDWIIRDEAIRQRLLKEVQALPLGVSVSIKETPRPRSFEQNATYWMWVDDFIKSGEIKDAGGRVYTKDQMHYELAAAFLEPVEWTNRKGKIRYAAKSTKDLSVADFSVYLNKIQELALKMGVFLRDPALQGLDMTKKNDK